MNVFRATLSRDFWITGIAIARYIPQAFRRKQIDGNLFFTEEKRREYRRRVESLKQDSLRRWGTMEVGQMLHQLNLACGGSQGFYDLPDESYLISRTLFKWILVTGIRSSRLACGSRQASKFHTHRDSNLPTRRGNYSKSSRPIGMPGLQTSGSRTQCSAQCRRRSGASFCRSISITT